MTGIPTAIVVGVGAEHGLGAALSGRFAAEGHRVPSPAAPPCG